jgi:hypothetical protein
MRSIRPEETGPDPNARLAATFAEEVEIEGIIAVGKERVQAVAALGDMMGRSRRSVRQYEMRGELRRDHLRHAIAKAWQVDTCEQ